MQNYLTARYRRVHDKIKDVRISDLASKFPKGIREIRIASVLGHLPQSPFVDKVALFSTKIVQFPYGNYWRKSWPYKYWAVGLIVSLPVFYQFQAVANTRTRTGSLDVVRRNVETQTETDGVSKDENILHGSK